MKREKEPLYLEENKEKWTDEYIEKKPKTFRWRCDYTKLIEDIKVQSDYHCAFCDRAMTPIGDADEEIEHFKPKLIFPELAYEWRNLYPICSKCNKIKLNRFSELLLRPDDENYIFDNLFLFNELSGELEPKYENSEFDKAEKTIELYGLNRESLTKRRKYWFKNRDKFNLDKNEQPFRFI